MRILTACSIHGASHATWCRERACHGRTGSSCIHLLTHSLIHRKQLFHHNQEYPFGPACMLTFHSPFPGYEKKRKKLTSSKSNTRQKSIIFEVWSDKNSANWNWWLEKTGGVTITRIAVSLARELSRAQSFSGGPRVWHHRITYDDTQPVSRPLGVLHTHPWEWERA